MSKYTPGPWRAISEDIIDSTYHEPCVITDGGGPTRTIASVRVGLTGTEANARLIAAAPDLLEACEEMIVRLTDLFDRRERPTYMTKLQADGDLDLILRSGREAVRKAKGLS